MKNNLTQNILFGFTILLFATAWNITYNNFVLFGFFIFSFFLYKRDKIQIDTFIVIIIIIILLNNFFITIIFGGGFYIIPLIGSIIRILSAYFVIKIFKKTFFDKYINLIYFMSIFSLPFYVIQLVAPSFFSHFDFIRNIIGTDLRNSVGKYDYIFHSINMYPEGIIRNSGFAWEPGAFAMLIAIALLLELLTKSNKITKRFVIMTLIGLTTLSTTYYIGLVFIMFFYFSNGKFKKKKIIAILIKISLISIFFVFVFTKFDFLQEKIITMYNHSQQMSYSSLSGSTAGTELGRFIDFKIDINDFIKYPLGMGVTSVLRTQNAYDEVLGGPNGFSEFIVRNGILGIIFLFLSLYQFPKRFGNFQSTYFIISIIVFLFSNPISRSLFLYIILFYPWITVNLEEKPN